MHADLQPRLAPLPLASIAALHLVVLGALLASRPLTAPRVESALQVELVSADPSPARPARPVTSTPTAPPPRPTPAAMAPAPQRAPAAPELTVQAAAAPAAAQAVAPAPVVHTPMQVPMQVPTQVQTPATADLPREPALNAPPAHLPAQVSTQMPAPAAAARPAVPSEPTTAPRFDAAYLDNPKPAYPPLSRRANEQGRVVLRVRVEASGLPSRVDVHTSSGHERLDRSAVAAVARWKFVPARQGGDAVAAWVHVPIEFSL